MYKSFRTKKYYFAVERFPKTRKSVSKVYHTGFRKFESDDDTTYSVVLGTYRVMFIVQKPFSCCNGN